MNNNEGPNNMNAMQKLGSDVIEILEGAWADIRHHNPDMAAKVLFRTGSGVTNGGLTLGSITVGTVWHDEDGNGYHELFIGNETLSAGPEAILKTMIHEAVHSVCTELGLKETSRQYRYHNRTFRAQCELAGMEWAHTTARTEGRGKNRVVLGECEGPTLTGMAGSYEQQESGPDETLGYSAMTLTDATLDTYADTLRNLSAIPVVYINRPTLTARVQTRKTACLVASTSDEAYEDRSQAEMYLDFADEDIQRMGVKIYEMMGRRGLLAPHAVWFEG